MVSAITFLFPWGENGIAPHQEHLKAGSSDAGSPHSLTVFPYRQEWRDKGQDGEWLEGGRLILQPVFKLPCHCQDTQALLLGSAL